MMMAAPPRTAQGAKRANRSFIEAKPEAGTLLLWESWLRHEVPVNAGRSRPNLDQLQLRGALTAAQMRLCAADAAAQC